MSEGEQERPVAPHRDQPRGGTGLVIIDMINDFDFEGGETLRAHAAKVVTSILHLRQQADRLNIPTIYVNDNFGEWHSERSALIERVQDQLVHPDIAPRRKDYFIIKPQLSGFYATNLQVLLPKLGISRLILTGIAADICVLFTAADARMRDYDIWLPRDCTAAQTREGRDAALKIAQDKLKAEIAATDERTLSAWMSDTDELGRLCR